MCVFFGAGGGGGQEHREHTTGPTGCGLPTNGAGTTAAHKCFCGRASRLRWSGDTEPVVRCAAVWACQSFWAPPQRAAEAQGGGGLAQAQGTSCAVRQPPPPAPRAPIGRGAATRVHEERCAFCGGVLIAGFVGVPASATRTPRQVVATADTRVLPAPDLSRGVGDAPAGHAPPATPLVVFRTGLRHRATRSAPSQDHPLFRRCVA